MIFWYSMELNSFKPKIAINMIVYFAENLLVQTEIQWHNKKRKVACKSTW